MKKSVIFYNNQVENAKDKNDILYDNTQFVWTRASRNDFSKRKKYNFNDASIRDSNYRPFFKQKMFYYAPLNEMTYQIPKLFPTDTAENCVICVNSVSGPRDFTCLITDKAPDLNSIGATQCFPLYWYEDNKSRQQTLFDSVNEDDAYIQRDGITDWILKEVRKRYGNATNITKEMIFYYVYGILHSRDYRERFAADLKKSLPRIPIVERVDDFMDFWRCGRKLADLHLNYETVPSYPDAVVKGDRAVTDKPTEDDYKYFRVEKLRFKSKEDKSVIIYNSNIVIENIPDKAYEYVVNGKSAIEWIVERYCVSQDKKSLIVNDANDWGREHGKPRYILDLLLSVINVSVQTVDIVNALPKLKFD